MNEMIGSGRAIREQREKTKRKKRRKQTGLGPSRAIPVYHVWCY
jgi:hypothetical protein